MTIKAVYLDTNFLIDALVDGKPQSEDAFQFLCAVGDNAIDGFVMFNQLVDFYYICRKAGVSDSARRKNVRLLLDVCTLFQPSEETLKATLDSDEPDFEDGLIRKATETVGTDFIVARDSKAFLKSAENRAAGFGLTDA